MAAEVFRVVSGADFCRRSPATPIQVRREGCRLRCQFYVSDIDSRPELPTSTSSAEFSRSRQRAHRDAQRGVCVWPSGEEKWYRGRQRSRPAWCVCGVCGVGYSPGRVRSASSSDSVPESRSSTCNTKRASVGCGRVPLLCSRGGHFLAAVTFGSRSRLAATPTFSETLSSFNECVRSLWVRNLSIIERRLGRSRLARRGLLPRNWPRVRGLWEPHEHVPHSATVRGTSVCLARRTTTSVRLRVALRTTQSAEVPPRLASETA